MHMGMFVQTCFDTFRHALYEKKTFLSRMTICVWKVTCLYRFDAIMNHPTVTLINPINWKIQKNDTIINIIFSQFILKFTITYIISWDKWIYESQSVIFWQLNINRVKSCTWIAIFKNLRKVKLTSLIFT